MWGTVIDDWVQWLRAAGRPASTIRLRSHQIRALSKHFPQPWTVTLDDLVSYLARPAWATDTRRSVRSALVTFYSWAEHTGRIPASPAAGLPTIREGHHQPRPTPEAIINAALDQADARGHLMLQLASRQGMRRGEIARTHTDDLIEDLDGWSLRVHGKGDRVRTIPLLDEVAAELLRRPRGFVFPGRVDGHLSADYVGKLLARALDRGWSAHTLRHRSATRMYAGTRDLLVVQDFLGHATPTTTRRYVLPPRDAMRAALAYVA